MKESYIAAIILCAVGLLYMQMRREEIKADERRNRRQHIEAARSWMAAEAEESHKDKIRANLFWWWNSVSNGGKI